MRSNIQSTRPLFRANYTQGVKLNAESVFDLLR
jgi:hypothetical protein